MGNVTGHATCSSSSSISWQTPTTTGIGPSPRGQPSVAADTAGTAVYLFGGWDGQQRYNDLYRLHVPQQPHEQWRWELMKAADKARAPAAPGGTVQDAQHAAATAHIATAAAIPADPEADSAAALAPCPRADHCMVREAWPLQWVAHTSSQGTAVGLCGISVKCGRFVLLLERSFVPETAKDHVIVADAQPLLFSV